MTKFSSKIVITCGDRIGIGLEIVSKALNKLILTYPDVQFLFFCNSSDLKAYPFPKDSMTVISSVSALKVTTFSTPLVAIANQDSEAMWVEQAMALCLDGTVHAMCNAPISKTTFRAAGLPYKGHNDLFVNKLSIPKTQMCFIARQEVSVVLATDHVPLSHVQADLTPAHLQAVCNQAEILRKLLRNNLPIGILGLNPHAGEDGIISEYEKTTLTPFLQKNFPNIVGPLAPDVAFLKENRSKYSILIALYHDQGLIPFKLINGFRDGYQLSLGLPFLRTSPDHGVARDLYLKNQADPSSIHLAIEALINLQRYKHV